MRMHSDETKRRISESLKRNSNRKGYHASDETKRRLSEAGKGNSNSKGRPAWNKGLPEFSGENNPQWKGGISFLSYPPEFNEELKQYIKERDGYKCQNEYCRSKSKKLDVHHIDYDKENCSEFNLLTLCTSCNVKANARHRWERYYRERVRSKYWLKSVEKEA